MMRFYIFAEWLFTFTEVAMFFYIVHATKKDQFEKKKQMIMFPVVAGVIAVGVILLNLVNFTSMMLTMVYASLVFTIGASILYKGNFLELLLENLIYISGLNMVEGMMLAVVRTIWSAELVAKMATGFCIERIIIVTSFKLLEILLAIAIHKAIKRFSIELKATWQAFLISVIGCIAAIFWVIQVTDVTNMKTNVFDLIVAALCIMICFMFYFIFRLQQAKHEQEHVSFENRLLKMNYQAAEDSYESNAKLYHDMRNHFSLLQTYLAEGKVEEAQQYLQKLGMESIAYSVEKWTGVDAIDYILSQKVEKARQNEIETVVHAEYPRECSIDPLDLCTILTNLFDNAIEACMKQTDGADRKIDLTIRRIHQFVIIKIENSSSVEPVMKSGSLVTSKKDGKHHGWGMKSVKSAVEKYNGTVEYEYKDGTFIVNAMMFYQ